ncbi:MAG: DUF1259 domain-containing protein [Alphaproteobacteria bacterium]
MIGFRRTLAAVFAATVLTTTGPTSAGAGTDWAQVEQVLGRHGTAQPGGVYRFAIPRSDLAVVDDGVDIRPSLALTSWLAFKDVKGGAVVTGDLVLITEEVSPVMARLLDGGIEITALHNHLIGSVPPIMYMHVFGRGDPVRLAVALRAALDQAGTQADADATSAAPPEDTDVDTASLDHIMGLKGESAGGVYHFTVPRPETITEAGIELSPAMGVATAINFQPTLGGTAAVTGDFVLTATEVNPVIRTLRANGIAVTAVHNHMLEDTPRLFFVHFWANGDPSALARGLRAALDKTASVHG